MGHRRYSTGRQNDPTEHRHPKGRLYSTNRLCSMGHRRYSTGRQNDPTEHRHPKGRLYSMGHRRYSTGRQNDPMGRHHPTGHRPMPPQAATVTANCYRPEPTKLSIAFS